MPERAVNLLLAIFGVAVVMGLVLVGADAWASSRRGPRWWRKLLGAGLVVLAMLGVGSCRRRTTCYAPRPLPPAKTSMRSLADQLPLLEQFAESKTLVPEAVAKVLGKAEADLEIRAKLEAKGQTPSKDLPALTRVAEDKAPPKDRPAPTGGAEGQAPSKDRPALTGVAAEAKLPLGKRPEWKRLTDAWARAEKAVSGPRFSYPFDAKGKEKLLADLAAAGRDVATLERAELLSAPEAGLLTKDLATLTRGVRMKRPTEMRRATCYKPMMFVPARESLKRLEDRMALLEELAAQGEVREVVVRRSLVRVARDILRLVTDEEALALLSKEERARAEQVGSAALKLQRKLLQKLMPQIFRPMCYAMELVPKPAKPEAWRIERRLEMLQRIAERGGVTPAALAKAGAAARAELAETDRYRDARA
ncbi:MAG: hypothetical protein ACYTFI_23205 [Planctomycetota bacterium]|jgi:hypothetical protein